MTDASAAGHSNAGGTTGGPSPQPAAFPPVQNTETGVAPKNIEFLLDIPMSVAVYVGSTKMAIRDLLQLAQGSVIELDKLAGEPMDVMVNKIGRAHV